MWRLLTYLIGNFFGFLCFWFRMCFGRTKTKERTSNSKRLLITHWTINTNSSLSHKIFLFTTNETVIIDLAIFLETFNRMNKWVLLYFMPLHFEMIYPKKLTCNYLMKDQILLLFKNNQKVKQLRMLGVRTLWIYYQQLALRRVCKISNKLMGKQSET